MHDALKLARRSIEDEIERLLVFLDMIDGDPDLEDGHDREPEETDCDLAGAGTDLELDPTAYGDGPDWSSDPNIPQEGWAWHGHVSGNLRDRNRPCETA